MTRMRVVLPAVIALGSNQGDREALLREAVRDIDALDGVRVTAASGIVETPALKPHGVDETAPSYLNAVVLAHAALSPEELLAALHGIEARLGRVRDEVWGDRTIDLDLIDFGGLTRRTDEITLPHPRAWQRAFVLAPWRQVQPDAVLPGHGRIDALLAATTDRVTEYPAAPLFTPDAADTADSTERAAQ
ncbi:MAG TPA: 2-amino-4-hydroxy-6-hydroxymethyldihydropteridine diphosphokinase [Terrimesophilobacter sp.]|nr:2-amino-4-hydroxy-6-hydroxymethyldihydropteridine diphosphokinase [Terrimesophilobacter sp.]